MVAAKRDYRALLLHGDLFCEPRRATRTLARNLASFRRITGSRSGEATIDVYDVEVVSQQPYARSPDIISDLGVRGQQNGSYQFGGYAAIYRRGSISLCLLGMPFFGLAREVIRNAAEVVRGDVPYRALALDQLVRNVLGGMHLGGKIVVRAVEFDVRGDDDVTRMAFRGRNTLYSKVYSRVAGSLKGITMMPRACSLIYDDYAGTRSVLDADRFGNFAFRLGSDGSALTKLLPLLEYCDSSNVIVAKQVDPTRRAEDGDLEAQ